MMDFITIPLVVGIITLGIYKLFELFARRKERLNIIEKIGDKLDASYLGDIRPIPVKISSGLSFGAFKAGCLLMGIGLGLLVGYLISMGTLPGLRMLEDNYQVQQITGVIFGASILLFSGLGLLVAFLVEMRFDKKWREGK